MGGMLLVLLLWPGLCIFAGDPCQGTPLDSTTGAGGGRLKSHLVWAEELWSPFGTTPFSPSFLMECGSCLGLKWILAGGARQLSYFREEFLLKAEVQ